MTFTGIEKAVHRVGLRRVHAAKAPVKWLLQGLGRMGMLPAIGGIPIRETGSVRMADGPGFLYNFDHNEDPIGEAIYWSGFERYEAKTMQVFLKYARTAKCVLDIGANTGVFSMACCAVNPGARVIAWEPVPAIWARLRANIATNGWTRRVDCRQAALGDHSGTASLRIIKDCSTSATLAETDFGRDRDAENIAVALERGDDVLGPDLRVDLIKIDVETAEHIVLSGMKRVLQESRPAIIAECLPQAGDHTHTLLNSLGYTAAVLDDSNFLFIWA